MKAVTAVAGLLICAVATGCDPAFALYGYDTPQQYEAEAARAKAEGRPVKHAVRHDNPAGGGARVVISGLPGTARPPFAFSPDDAAFLELVQRGCWNWAVDAANPVSGMVPDRDSQSYASTAGVGFQLAAFPVAVEHGWMGRAEAERRVLTILTTLANAQTTRKFGMFQHFVDGATGELPRGPYEDVVSTIDSALLMCGCIVASSYFGGEIARVADRLVAAADWAAFLNASPDAKPHERGFVSLGWKPKDLKNDPVGEGAFLPYYWLDAGCEHRIVSFLAVAAPDEAKRAPAELYYRLRRQVGIDTSLGASAAEQRLVYFPWSGALFTSQFSHVFLNYGAMGPDDPAAHGVPGRARVDWWENSRRTTNLHRARCAAYGRAHPGSGGGGFGPDAWGLTASDCTRGYQVPGVFPELDEEAMAGSRLLDDFSWFRPKDDFGDGSIAPYAAGMSVLFEPGAAVAALRHYRSVAETGGGDLRRVWDEPAKGGYGFADAFNVQKEWVSKDRLAIDQLPMLLAIENARTGLVWRLFHAHRVVRAGLERLRLVQMNVGS